MIQLLKICLSSLAIGGLFYVTSPMPRLPYVEPPFERDLQWQMIGLWGPGVAIGGYAGKTGYIVKRHEITGRVLYQCRVPVGEPMLAACPDIDAALATEGMTIGRVVDMDHRTRLDGPPAKRRDRSTVDISYMTFSDLAIR
jgi:hypothetical protein